MLLITSVITGMAHGQAPATGHMVLCSGSMTVTVYVDADGRPVHAPHICPDCVLAADGLTINVTGASVRAGQTARRAGPALAHWPQKRGIQTVRARGPPVQQL